METSRTYTDEPISSWLRQDLDQFLLWATEQGASDILLQPGTPIWIRLHGQWVLVTNRILSSDEISMLVDDISSDDASSAKLKGGDDLDFAHEIQITRLERVRFRVNASACQDGYGIGVSMVLRTIPSLPPTVEELGVEPELLDAAFPNNGLVLITGVMGTGKSTLLASLLRRIRETMPKNVITYEAPIEFDLMGIPNPMGPLVQTQIPIHLSDFHMAPRNAARRAADVILVGESRDTETLKGMLESAEIGVCAYSTVHTRSVAETPSRIINVFPEGLQHQIASTLISSLRLIVQQRLLPAKAGQGRVAIKEYLIFNATLRKALFNTKIENLISTIEDMVESHGQTLLSDAEKKYNDGLIFKEDLEAIQKERENQ